MPILTNLVDRRTARRLALLVLATLLVSSLAGIAAAAAELVNRVVIRVNDRIVTLHDYESRLADLREELSRRQDVSLAERRELAAEAPERVFNDLLQEALLLSRADQLGIVFTEAEVDQRIQQIRQSYGVESEEEFRSILIEQGMDLRRFREQVRTGMRLQELMGREVRSRLDVGEELARLYYRDNPEEFMAPQRLRLKELVVLEGSDLDREERLELARSLRAELLASRAIEELAEEYEEQGTEIYDLGWMVGGELARELEDAVWDLQPLQVSEPVDFRGGIHVIQVQEREEERQLDFAEVAGEAERRAGNVAFAEAMEEFLEDLEQRSYVRLDPPPEAADFRRAVREPMEELPALQPEDATVAGDAAAAEETAAEDAAAEEVAEEVAEEAAEPPVDGPGSER